MAIDHRYWEQDCERYHARQAEKEALKSHSQKQGKASTFGSVTASQSKANLSLAASSAKNLPSKSSPSPAPKKQPNTSWVDLSSCYDSRLKGLSQETTLVLSNTRELDRVPSTE